MKKFRYIEQAEDGIGHVTVDVTEDDIIRSYYPDWERRMIKKFGEGHELTNHQTCIEDYCVAHWAREI